MPTVLGFPVCGRLDSVQRRGPAPKRSCDETDCSSGSIRVLHLGVFRRPGYGTDISLRPYPSERTRSGVAANRYEKYFGGRRIAEGPDRIMFGSTRLLFMKKADAKPSSGSVVDHIGFSFADLDAKMREFEAAGIKIVTPAREVPGLFKLGFVEDPWGTRIEVVQDPELLGLHHIQMRGPNPDGFSAGCSRSSAASARSLKDASTQSSTVRPASATCGSSCSAATRSQARGTPSITSAGAPRVRWRKRSTVCELRV